MGTGRGVCYHKNGKIGLILTTKYAGFHGEDGSLTEKIKWPYCALKPPLSFQLTTCLKIKVAHLNTISVHVKIDGESAKVEVGASPKAVVPKLDSMGPIQTQEN